MEMVQGLYASVSGIQASSLRVSTAAHNVANINTPGFEASRVVTSESGDSGVEARLQKVPNPSKDESGTDLATETVEEIKGLRELQANTQSIKTQDQMLGSLLDIRA